MSRATVARMLKEAKLRGLVQVTITVPVRRFELADQVRDRWAGRGLRRVHLVPTVPDPEEQKTVLARELPTVFTPPAGSTVAVSWGTTLSRAVDLLPAAPRPRVERVVSVLGGIQGAIRAVDPYDVVVRLGQKLGATVYALPAPGFVRDPGLAAVLKNEPAMRQVLELGATADVVMFGAGDLRQRSTLERIGAITPEERAWLVGQGALGDILGHFLDAEGRVVTEAARRLIPISLGMGELRAIPERICIAGGEDKRAVILAMLRGGLITTLLTDETTAAHLAQAPPGGKEA